VRSCGVGGGI